MKRARARYSVRLPVTPAAAQAQVRRRADRTEDSLTRWRVVAAGRRRAYELAQWVAAEKARRRRRRWLRGLRGAVSTLLVVALTVGAVAVQSGPDAEARVVSPQMAQDAPPELTSTVMSSGWDAPVSAPAPTAIPDVSGSAPAPTFASNIVVEALAPAFDAGPPLPVAFAAVGVKLSSVEQWSDDEYRWVRFEVQTQQPTYIRWRDASGEPAIEDKPCAVPGDGGHVCRFGRSHWRFATALRDGASPGEWTIEACTGGICQVVDTLDVGIG